MSKRRVTTIEKEPVNKLENENNLHFAIRSHKVKGRQETLKTVTKIVKKSSSKLAKAQNDLHETPLHTGMRHGAPADSIEVILNAYRQAAKANSKIGGTALAVGMTWHAPSESIELLLDAYPEAAAEVDTKERNPLHLLFDKQEEFKDAENIAEIVQAFAAVKDDDKKKKKILEKVPEMKDWWGRTPLHVAILMYAPIDAVLALLDMCPKAAKIQDKKGRTPLHCAVQKKVPQRITMAILKCFAKATIVQDSMGRTPLHVAMQTHECETVVKKLMENSPKEIIGKIPKNTKIQDMNGMTPLHLGCEARAPLECLFAVLRANQKATHTTDKDKRIPLHIAMASSEAKGVKEGDPVIQALLDVWPKSARANEIKQQTPLHVGMENKARVDAIQLVMPAYLGAVRDLDFKKRTPLHVGMRFQAKLDAIKLLLEESKAIVMMQDANGSTALHLGIEKGAPLDVVDFVAKKFPEATRIRDKLGRTPLHVAMESQPKLDIVQAILEVKDRKHSGSVAAAMKDYKGCTPLDIGIRENVASAILRIVENACISNLDTSLNQDDTTTGTRGADFKERSTAKKGDLKKDDLDSDSNSDFSGSDSDDSSSSSESSSLNQSNLGKSRNKKAK